MAQGAVATPENAGEHDGRAQKPKRMTRKELKEEVRRLQAKEPDSLWDAVKFPLILAVVFAVSLLIFHHAPHEKSTRKGFKLPRSPARSANDAAGDVPNVEPPPAEL